MSNYVIIENNERFETKQIISKSGITYLEIYDKINNKCFIVKDIYEYIIINDLQKEKYILYIKFGIITKPENKVYEFLNDTTLSNAVNKIMLFKSKFKDTITIPLNRFIKKINISERCRLYL